jgi:hypothetical protein
MMENKKCLKPATSSVFYTSSWHLLHVEYSETFFHDKKTLIFTLSHNAKEWMMDNLD